MTKPGKPCKDCRSEERSLTRAAPYPGPRCATHHRVARARQRAAVHDRAVQAGYGLGPGDYARLWAAQGGRCALCRRATGATKRLAVDHDHATGLVRGLLCSVCNRLLGHGRDDPDFFVRVIEYLVHPPARAVLA